MGRSILKLTSINQKTSKESLKRLPFEAFESFLNLIHLAIPNPGDWANQDFLQLVKMTMGFKLAYMDPSILP